MVISRQVPAKKNPYFSGFVSDVTVAVGVEASNIINVAMTLLDRIGVPLITAGGGFFAYLSDNADGSTIAASAPSSGWAIGTNGLLIPVVTNKAAYFTSKIGGLIDVSITEVTAKTFYLVIVLPTGKLKITAVTFA